MIIQSSLLTCFIGSNLTKMCGWKQKKVLLLQKQIAFVLQVQVGDFFSLKKIEKDRLLTVCLNVAKESFISSLAS